MRPRAVIAALMAMAGTVLAAQGSWIHVKAELAQVLLHRAWNEAREQGGSPPPWPWADTSPVARIRVGRLDIDQLVLASASGRNLAFGPTHVSPSVLPGRPGHSVISGHRDTHFSFLAELEPGDRLDLQGLQGGVRQFEVHSQRIIDLRRSVLGFEPEVDRLSLVTCYPFDAMDPGTPLRYVVDAVPVAAGH